MSAKLGYGKFQLFSLTAVGILVRPLGSAYLLPASRLLPQRGHDLDAAFLLVNFGYELRHFYVRRDRDIGAFLVDAARDFMACVRDGVPPEPTPGVDTYEAITRRFAGPSEQTLDADESTAALIAEFAEVKAAKEAAKEREETLKATLATRIGSAYGIDAGTAGRVLWPESKGKTSFDTDGLIRDLKVPDDVLQKYTRIGAPYRTMRYYPAKKRK